MVLISSFVICGFFIGVDSFILVGRLGKSSQGISQDALFSVLAAAVIGGVSLYGDRGRTMGMIGGVLLMSMITNALKLVNIPSEYIYVVTGTVIIIAIIIDSMRRRRTAME